MDCTARSRDIDSIGASTMTIDQLQRRVGTAFRKHRELQGVSQEVFAERIEMHRTYYSAIERGEKNLTLETCQRICSGLKTPQHVIFREAET